MERALHEVPNFTTGTEHDHNDPDWIRTAVDDLERYIADEGPFDAVLAFSMGAALAASLLIRRYQQNPVANDFGFKMAVFLFGSLPYDYTALNRGELRMIESTDGVMINVPTANIWGDNDREWPHSGVELVKLCKPEVRYQFLHQSGHQIPTSPKEVVAGMANTIKSAMNGVPFT